jgi:hypothetical protein
MGKILLWMILIALVVRSLSRLLRGVLEGAGYRREINPPRSVGLVKDPVCGVFVVPGKALTAGSGSSLKHFCSEKCRRQWVKA